MSYFLLLLYVFSLVICERGVASGKKRYVSLLFYNVTVSLNSTQKGVSIFTFSLTKKNLYSLVIVNIILMILAMCIYGPLVTYLLIYVPYKLYSPDSLEIYCKCVCNDWFRGAGGLDQKKKEEIK